MRYAPAESASGRMRGASSVKKAPRDSSGIMSVSSVPNRAASIAHGAERRLVAVCIRASRTCDKAAEAAVAGEGLAARGGACVCAFSASTMARLREAA